MGRKNKESVEKPRLTEQALEVIIIKAVVLFFVAILVYIPAMSGGYIYDDDQLLFKNPAIRRGEGWNADAWKGLWAFWYPVGENANVAADYAPVADTTLWVEWRLWGNNDFDGSPDPDPHFRGWGAPGYHITNIVFHAAGAILLWYLLVQMAIPGAWLAALVWAVHPVNAESVAWISERRNTISMILFMLTMINWYKFQQTRRWSAYGLAVFLFLLTMFTKASIVMLPLVLLLCIWWMRNNVTLADLVESAPFFLISYIFGKITLYFQNDRAIAREMVYIGNFFERFCGACFALGFYFYKILLPVNLNLIYQQWHKMLPWSFTSITQELPIERDHVTMPYSFTGLAEELIIGVAFAVFFLWAWLRRATWGRHAIFGMGFFVIMIAPVLGFTRMAYMRLTLVSDHFDYAPMVGVIALCVAGLIEVNKRLQPSLRWVLMATGAGIIGMFCVLTWVRADIFSQPEKLWRDNIAKNPESWQGHSHLGAILWRKHDLHGAYVEWKQSATLAPYLYEVHNNYALVLNAMGLVDESLEQYKIAVNIEPGQFQVRANYAQALSVAHHFEEAADQYEKVLDSSPPGNPNNPIYFDSLGVCLFQIGRLDDAINCFQRAVQLAPNWPDAKNHLNTARLKRQEELEKSSGSTQPAPAQSGNTGAGK